MKYHPQIQDEIHIEFYMSELKCTATNVRARHFMELEVK